ncbi:MAG: hypothetical protein WAX69_12360 [Victivallales bacterium]
MDDFGNYQNGLGTTGSPNEAARNLIVQEMRRQNLRPVFKLPLERMSFIVYEDVSDTQPPKTQYMIQWRGDVSP